ncbi:hypothetical protein HYE67_006910 [Fusarium culmorum]|uniref:Uncharacterized protein n=1 Tax=Fusarium culmorum TaxID=5516 RepID=A0A2T4H1S1_FUSCU|nr:hypothetical protein FCULG_00007951 [Fusarium culmorum]QPC64679.1 hypothetical protein HYE67_006910 [Fusarium culmorum]
MKNLQKGLKVPIGWRGHGLATCTHGLSNRVVLAATDGDAERNAVNGQQCAENWPCFFIDDELWPESYTAMCSCPRYVGPNILVSTWHSTPSSGSCPCKADGNRSPRVKGVVDPKHCIAASAAFEPSRCLMNGTVVVSSGDSAERVEEKLEKGNRKGPTSGSHYRGHVVPCHARALIEGSIQRPTPAGVRRPFPVANGMHVPLGYLSCVSV